MKELKGDELRDGRQASPGQNDREGNHEEDSGGVLPGRHGISVFRGQVDVSRAEKGLSWRVRDRKGKDEGGEDFPEERDSTHPCGGAVGDEKGKKGGVKEKTGGKVRGGFLGEGVRVYLGQGVLLGVLSF